jgi:hypothetical protein
MVEPTERDDHAPDGATTTARMDGGSPQPARERTIARLSPDCSADLETVACSETGRWLCRDDAEREWRRCEHWAIDAVKEQRRAQAARR